MHFTLNSQNYCQGDSSNEPYGDWYEHNSINYRSASIGESWNGVALFPGQTEPKRGDNIFVVGVSYSSGNSFGYGTGYHELIWAFTDSSLAFKLKDLLEEDDRKHPDYNYGGNYVDFEGVRVSTSTWKGYFERLERVFVERLMVE